MPADLDLSRLCAHGSPFIVGLITDRPGALAVMSRNNYWMWSKPLTRPLRGKRFGRSTETGRVLHAMHTDGLLGQVFINLHCTRRRSAPTRCCWRRSPASTR